MTTDVKTTFDRTVVEGKQRLGRTWAGLAATGAVGGADVGLGLLALFVVRADTGSPILGALAFGIGFLALTMAGSELFTENFLVPFGPLITHRARWRQLLRLWVITLVTNLLAGWVVTGLTITALPRVRPVALEIANQYLHTGVKPTLAAAVLGGMTITLMTWMQHSTESVPAQLIAALGFAFLLAVGPLGHAVVGSLEFFAALQVGAPFGYLDWLRELGWFTLGNVIGGAGLVTTLRLVQVGRQKLEEHAATADA